MTELKTIKEIEVPYDDDYNFDVIKYNEKLKAEAIKWVKEFYSSNPNDLTSLYMERYWICKWIMNFFNITEEDLKEQNK